MRSPLFRGRVSAAAGALLVLGGCAEDERVTTQLGQFDLAPRAEQVRELDFLEEVPVLRMTQAEFQALNEADAEAIAQEELDLLRDTYGRLGFFPLDRDLRADIGASLGWAAGTYSYEEKRIVLVGEIDNSVLVHEYVHALQDQHFDLRSFDDAADSSDAHLARRGVVEGDAVLAQVRFLMQESSGGDLYGLDWGRFFQSQREQSAELVAQQDAPLLFAAYPAFAYSHGLEYTAHNLTGATFDSPVPTRGFPYDWSLEDELFTARAPETTQQLLRLDDIDPIEHLGLHDVPTSLEARYVSTDWDSLGEWYTRLLLLPVDGSAGVGDVRGLAAAWDGDTALFLRDGRTAAPAAIWTSAWDDEGAATRVAAALWALHEASPDAEEPRSGTAADGEPVWIERRADRVVASKNVDPQMAAEVAEASFAATVEAKGLTPRTRPSLSAWLRRRVR